jgi:hypothetical protein
MTAESTTIVIIRMELKTSHSPFKSRISKIIYLIIELLPLQVYFDRFFILHSYHEVYKINGENIILL